MTAALHTGDCLEVLKTLPDSSISAIVTDPPYGLAFMGKRWDYAVPGVEVWAECLRVLKPGGHLLAFAGTRTQHRMCCRIEDAGFEIRDMLAWVYGSGFPKSHDVSKAIDKAAGAEREVVGVNEDYLRRKPNGMKTAGATAYGYSQSQQETDARITAPATDAARQWQGWGNALKPALEPLTLARKPLTGTVAANVLEYGTGALNVDGCRVEGAERPLVTSDRRLENNTYGAGLGGSKCEGTRTAGRFPANFIHDGSDEVTDLLGNAARFFYCAKASRSERNAGCDGIGSSPMSSGDERPSGGSWERRGRQKGSASQNNHPTVKPVALMRYLVRLVTPPGGVVLDPFMGSGTTGVAAKLEGMRFIGIEQDPAYVEIARQRIDAAGRMEPEQADLFKGNDE